MTYKVPTWSVCFLTFHLHLIPSCLPVIMVGESSVRPFWSSYRPSPHLPPGSHLEQRKIYCRAEQGEWLAHAQKLPSGFQGSFYRQIWSKGCRMCDFLLIGWRGNRALLQESYPQPKVAILHLGGSLSSWFFTSSATWEALSSGRRTQRYYIYVCVCVCVCIPWWGTRTLTIPHFFLLTASFLLLCSLTSLISNWICSLELMEGLGGWSLFSCKQETGDTERICTQEDPTGFCSASVLLPHS